MIPIDCWWHNQTLSSLYLTALHFGRAANRTWEESIYRYLSLKRQRKVWLHPGPHKMWETEAPSLPPFYACLQWRMHNHDVGKSRSHIMACTLYETSPALELILDPKEEGWRRVYGSHREYSEVVFATRFSVQSNTKNSLNRVPGFQRRLCCQWLSLCLVRHQWRWQLQVMV